MASSVPLCGICDHRHIFKPTEVWCSECDEGFCTECVEHHSIAKATRHHTTITINEYRKLPSSILEIDHSCRTHNEKFILFCKEHDCPCCRSCTIDTHKQCQNIEKLENVIQNVKTSNAFLELEQMLHEVSENIRLIIIDREKNLGTLSDKRMVIEKEIREIKTKLIEHIDKLQDDVLKRIASMEEKEKEKISQLLEKLREKEDETKKIDINLQIIKQSASDLQAYLAMKQIETDLGQHDKYIEDVLSSDQGSDKIISFNIDSNLKSFQTNIKQFGQIVLDLKEGCGVLPVRRKSKQAQIILPEIQLRRSIDNLNFELRRNIKIDAKDIRGCCLLPGDKMVFSLYYTQYKVALFHSDDTQVKIKTPSLAFDVAYNHDDKTVVVTNGYTSPHCISQIDIACETIKNTFTVYSCNYGIFVKNNVLFYCTDNSICSLNLSDKSVIKIVSFDCTKYTYIGNLGDKLFHSNNAMNTVTCYDFQGTLLWTFKDESILRKPYGISVDNNGNVFVVGKQSANVVVISPDGQRCRELLSSADGLVQPYALSYDQTFDLLLVANDRSEAFLYKVS